MSNRTAGWASLRREESRRAAEGLCRACGAPLAVLDEVSGKKICSALCRGQRTCQVAYASCVFCKELFIVMRSGPRHNRCLNPDCRRKARAVIRAHTVLSEAAQARRRAATRTRHHVRRTSLSDLTAGQEMAMRKKAKNCPLCGVRMTDKPRLPNSKELDHIVPLGVGGTHTSGNCRIICRLCNCRRPKDGSDFTGQLTLWAQIPGVVARTRYSARGISSAGKPIGMPNGTMCRNGLHPWTTENIVTIGGRRQCGPCRTIKRQQLNRKNHPQQTCQCGALFSRRSQGATSSLCAACNGTRARKAADLHAEGLTWDQVAAELGYAGGSSACVAAGRTGYTGERPGYGGHRGRKAERVAPELATAEKARRAADMRKQGMTLWAIADEFGYRSHSGVRYLLRVAVTMSDEQMMRAS